MTTLAHTVTRKGLFESSWVALEPPGGGYHAATSVSFSDDGRYCAVGAYDGRVFVWDFATLRTVVRFLPAPPSSVCCPAGEKVLASPVRCLAWGRGRAAGAGWELAVGYTFHRTATEAQGAVVCWDLVNSRMEWVHR